MSDWQALVKNSLSNERSRSDRPSGSITVCCAGYESINFGTRSAAGIEIGCESSLVKNACR